MMKMANLVNIQNNDKRGLETTLLRELPQLIPSLKVIKTLRMPKVGAIRADLEVEVMTPPGRKQRLIIEIKSVPTPGLVREALRRLKSGLSNESRGYPVLASFFISKRIREICREEGVGYLDLAGNCYIRLKDLYLEKVVDKNPFPKRGRPASLFTPVSSRILRVFLEEPNRKWTVRELSEVAKVSLGQTSNVCQRLSEEEYIVRGMRRIQIVQPAKLLDTWREQYKFSQNEQMGYYSFEREPDQLMARIAGVAQEKKWQYAITSFAAAARVAPFIRGIGTVAWYVDHMVNIELWVKALDLRPTEAGANAVLVIPFDPGVFYRAQVINGIALVGNIQLYLDLYGDPTRGREQAEFLRKEKIGF